MLFQVCTNGIVCLGGYTTAHRASPFPLNNGNMGVIAPYWGDADPRKGGTVWSRVSTDIELLNNVSLFGERQHLSLIMIYEIRSQVFTKQFKNNITTLILTFLQISHKTAVKVFEKSV